MRRRPGRPGRAGVAARPRDERGAVTVFVIGFAVILVACAGLVIDGGNALNARMTLADDAEQAARAGAQQIDIPYLRSSNVVVLDRTAARNRAVSYLHDIGYRSVDASVVQSPDGRYTSVRVAAEATERTSLLGLIGIGSFTVRASATAQAVTQ